MVGCDVTVAKKCHDLQISDGTGGCDDDRRPTTVVASVEFIDELLLGEFRRRFLALNAKIFRGRIIPSGKDEGAGVQEEDGVGLRECAG